MPDVDLPNPSLPDVDLPGMVRRIRRAADLSQRELAEQIGVAKSSVGRVESGASGLDVRALARAAALGGLRLALLDATGNEVPAMGADTVRDGVNRRFPAHLDTRYSEEDWWHGPHRYARDQPWYTFDRDRRTRDWWRTRTGTPADHQLPQPGDSPAERADARRREHLRRRAEDRQRRFLAGEFRDLPEPFECTCPPGCDDLDDRSGPPVHAESCPCSCDLC
jgi:transcriptional regulator with XRE-family HTH domain